MLLTDKSIHNAKPREKQYKLYDCKGLSILIMPNGSKLWRFAYRFGGKQKSLSMGIYPEVSLKEAREKREEARAKVKEAVDPSEERREAKRNVVKQNNVTFRLNLSPSGDLTILTPTRIVTLNPAQTGALRAFLIATSTEN